MKKQLFLIIVIIFISIIALIFIFKNSILQSFSNYLIINQPLSKTEWLVILSGNAFDRCKKGAKLYQEKWVQKILLVGGVKSNDVKALDLDYFESDICKINLTKHYSIPDSAITVLHIGTSTFEEVQAIKDFCIKNNIKKIAIVSSSFHTRRILQVCNKFLKPENIEFTIVPAPSSQYEENTWWQSEQGLLALQAEYIKQMYYLIKH